VVDLRITGANQLGDLARRLRAEGDAGKGLKREMVKGITRATKPMRADAKAAAKSELPQSGGLNAVVAKASMRTKVSTGRNPGVTIVARGTAVRSTDRGFVRHPVFGNREVWVTTRVTPGWFTEAMQKSAPKVRGEIVDAMQAVARRIARG
jgi:hypothetical protein